MGCGAAGAEGGSWGGGSWPASDLPDFFLLFLPRFFVSAAAAAAGFSVATAAPHSPQLRPHICHVNA